MGGPCSSVEDQQQQIHFTNMVLPVGQSVILMEAGDENSDKFEKRRPFPLKQTIRLVAVGCVLTSATNFPSAFMHTSVNTAVAELDIYLSQSYTERGNEFEEKDYSLIRSAFNSCWYAGQIIGAICSPIFCDRRGRKPAYLVATCVMTFAVMLQMLATLFPYPEFLAAGRVLASLFSPMSDTVAILYLQEISPPHLRGALSSLFATGYAFMGLLGMLLGTRPVLGHSLTLLFFVPILPGLFSMAFLAWIPETPKYLLIAKKDRGAACRSLRFYQGNMAVTKQALNSYMEESRDEPLDQNENNSILNLFYVPYLRKAMFLSLAVMVPTLAFYPLLQSSTYILLSLHVSKSLAQMSSTLMMLLLTICCILSAFLLDNFYRRTLLLVFGVGSVFSLLIFVCSAVATPFVGWMRYGAISGIMGYIVCYGLAIGPISYFIAPELVPMQYRSSMFCICFALISLLIVITNFATLPLYGLIGPSVFVPLFVIPSILSLFYLWIYLPETKGKETHQIVEMLKLNKQGINYGK
ncbi:hypothetical protein ACQ4LE_002672 [Meloidogyne hapla]|uniref:MFS domain-containing protein n=1 Tax=Meloidogyne hapla TaxID=6305 RepID=A0A1I8BRX0_MELHA